MRRNVTTRLARTRAEARDYRSTNSLEGFQIHRLAHAFCNSLNSGGEWVGLSWTLLCHRPRLLQSIADVLQHPRVRRGGLFKDEQYRLINERFAASIC